MANYKDAILLKEIGKRLKIQRRKEKLEIKDVCDMTGFTADTIKNVESGNETSISYFIEICRAINIHPREIFDFPIVLKPRNQISPSRMEKTRLTNRIKDYVSENYFDKYRATADVREKLESDYSIKTTSAAISVILARLVKSKALTNKKGAGKNLYKNR